jgi:hypothetical protein
MADSHHYTALYNVVTDLILYQDPEQRQRSQKMDTFVYSFDRRDAYRYVTEVTQLQQRIRESESLIKAYEEHYTHLAPEGKLGLIDIRADLLSSVENLNMIYDAVSLHRNYTERAAALKGSIRLKAHAGEVAWYMFGADTLLAKVTMTGTEFDWIRKKDSSTDSTLTVADMQALNSSPDAVFPEMLAKYQKGGGRETKVSRSFVAIVALEGFNPNPFTFSAYHDCSLGRTGASWRYHDHGTATCRPSPDQGPG